MTIQNGTIVYIILVAILNGCYFIFTKIDSMYSVQSKNSAFLAFIMKQNAIIYGFMLYQM